MRHTQVVGSFAQLTKTMSHASIDLLSFLSVACVAIFMLAFINAMLFGAYTDNYENFWEAMLSVFDVFANGANFDASSIEYSAMPLGYTCASL